MSNTVTVHINVDPEEPPQFHCAYSASPGEFSIRVARDDVTVYIAGTFAELRDWATQFIAAAIDGRSAVERDVERDTTND